MATNPQQSNWQQFVSVATKIAKKTGFPVGVLLGQAALESARGQAAPGNNYFGIKGQGTAGTQNLATQEANAQGQMYSTRGGFAAYKSPEDSVMAYINLIKNNYPQAWAARGNPIAMLQAIKQGGYATDPNYVAKVASTPEFQAEHGSLQGIPQQTPPADLSASFPQSQNPASQSVPYPLRDMLSQQLSQGNYQTTMPQSTPSRQPIVTVPQLASNGSFYSPQAEYESPTLPSSYIQGLQTSQAQAAQPQAPQADQSQNQPQSTQQSSPTANQPQQTYSYGPITI